METRWQDEWMIAHLGRYLLLAQLLEVVTVHAVNSPPRMPFPLPACKGIVCQFCHPGSLLPATAPCYRHLIVLNPGSVAHQH